jgi:hypothetical protein
MPFNPAGWAKVHCVFHGPDKEPSLSIHRGGGFRCFACDAKGSDVLEFEHLRTGRDRRAIAQSWGAWSGTPIVERLRTPPPPRPVVRTSAAPSPREFSPEFLEAVRLAYPAILASAHELADNGYSAHALDGKAPRGHAWQRAPRKTHADIDCWFQPRWGIHPNVGFRIDAEPGGVAPNAVVDIDLRTDDEDAIARCMDTANRFVGGRQPTVRTGRGGLHYYLRLETPLLENLFGGDRPNVIKVDWDGKDSGKSALAAIWTIEMLGPRHNVVCPPSVHPITLKPYEWSAPR